MFLYELARDSRTASIFAGITPMVGLPAYGFNFGPTSPISFFGSWGLKDDVVPPEVGASALNCTLPCRTSQSNGWFYESSECTTDEWQDVLGLDQAVDAGNFGNRQNTACWIHFSAISDIEVVVISAEAMTVTNPTRLYQCLISWRVIPRVALALRLLK